jgi:hypothetical protein
MKLPKVLVFTITYEGKEYTREQFMSFISGINYPKQYYRHIIIDNSPTMDYYNKLVSLYGSENVYHTERGNNSRESLARSQNFARRIALNDNYDYLMSIESDIMVPPNVIQHLISRGVKVVSTLYFIGDRKKGQRVPCITLPKFFEDMGAWGSRLIKPEEYNEYLNQGLKPVHSAGMGCCLITRNVFEKFTFYYDPRGIGHSDIFFFQDCFINKIPVYVDTDILTHHENSLWTDVKDR